MQVQRQIRRRVRRSGNGVGVFADVNVAVAGSLAEPERATRTSVHTRQTVVLGRSRRAADDPDTKEANQ